jgi:hypothetical protein
LNYEALEAGVVMNNQGAKIAGFRVERVALSVMFLVTPFYWENMFLSAVTAQSGLVNTVL